MPIGLESLLNSYSSAIQEGAAALFVGAGMSIEKVEVDWRELLRPYARLVNLDVDREDDLVAVAQYYLNSRNGERSFLNQALIDRFDRPGTVSRNHQILAALPISTIWTTNYDRLIEQAFGAANKSLDVKLRDKDVGFSRKECAAVLYKMHGDITQPDKVIVAKEDYERYARTHPVFQSILTADLLRKNFLFLGLSFEDPNLKYTLGHLCSVLENKKRGHHAIMRYVLRERTLNEATRQFEYTEDQTEFEYKKEKQARQVDDLQRYGIETILIDQWAQLTEILELLERINVGRTVETPVLLPSEREAQYLFEDIMTKLTEAFQQEASELSKERLQAIVEDTAKDIVERETGINLNHIDKAYRPPPRQPNVTAR